MKKKTKKDQVKWIEVSSGNRPPDDVTVLVVWRDRSGRWSSPIRAYYDLSDEKFFPIEGNHFFPLMVDRYLEIPPVSLIR